ncbi:hypothetical protein [Streptomyces sp. NPDC096012]|uniref:hypothetical protein n=1 Tax=Streptomyces sp. NPDC096012 TaxID=3155684 RepID=UPI003369EEB9
MRPRRPAAAAAVATALVALTAGCTGQGGASSHPAPGSPSATAPAGTPTGYADMRKKVDAAESAAAAADRDAADPADR